MHRRRVDITPTITILGCTLWSHISDAEALSCATLLTDFDEEKGIRERTVHEHNADHLLDLAFLNAQVTAISSQDPEREIVILSHHSPTIDARANDPRHARNSTNSGFRTDLSGEVCWRSERVKMWGFGHTHYNCQFYDEGDGDEEGEKRRKIVIANQKGYAMPGGKGKGRVEVVVVEAANEGEWRVIVGAKESKVKT